MQSIPEEPLDKNVFWCGLLQVTNVKNVVITLNREIAFSCDVKHVLMDEKKEYKEHPFRIFCPALLEVDNINKLPGFPMDVMNQLSFKYIPFDEGKESKIAFTYNRLENFTYRPEMDNIIPIFGLFRANEVHHHNTLCDDVIHIHRGKIKPTKK